MVLDRSVPWTRKNFRRSKFAETIYGKRVRTPWNYRVYFMLTNIMDESSDVIYYGEGSEEMGKIAFQQEPEDKCFHLKGVVSRKKQMIPAMMEAAQIMANDFN